MKVEGAAPNAHRWTVFTVISLVYFFVYFHRVSTSVIVTDLLRAFETDATALGFMSSLYFYLYAFEQPLVGYLSDRIGPRRVIGYWSIAAASGCLIFGLSPNIAWACIGRALIGLGVGGVYVPAIKALSQWFEKRTFATMIGLLMSVGNLGAVIATTPLAWMAATWGWRLTFFLIGGLTLALAVATLLWTRDYTASTVEAAPADPESPGLRTKVLQVMASGQLWIVATIFFGIYGTLVTLQGLWATPYLMSVLGVGRMFASNLNMLIPIGVIVGAPFFGWIADRLGLDKRNVLIFILAVYAMTWITMIFFYESIGTIGFSAVLTIMGLATGGFISTLWGIVREITAPRVLGLTSGLLNPAPFLGVAVFQVVTGAILDSAGRMGELYPISGFVGAFKVCLVGILFCIGLSLFIAKRHPRTTPL